MYSLSRWTRRARNRTGARRRPGSRRCESRRRHQKDSRARIVSDLLPSSRNHPQRSIECAGHAVIRRHAHPFAGGRARGGRGGLLRLYDLGTGWGVPPDNVAPIASVSGWPPSVGTTLADSDSVPATVIGEVRLNTRTLVPATGTRVQLNFPTDASTPSMINGMDPCAVACDVPAWPRQRQHAESQQWSNPPVFSSLWAGQEQYGGGPCLENQPWTEDEARILDFSFVVGNDCTPGIETSGIGSCQRTIDACDAYGNVITCSPAGLNPDGGSGPGPCTTNSDCIANWNAVYLPDGGRATPLIAGISENQSCYNQLGNFMTDVCIPNQLDDGPDPCLADFNCTTSPIFDAQGCERRRRLQPSGRRRDARLSLVRAPPQNLYPTCVRRASNKVLSASPARSAIRAKKCPDGGSYPTYGPPPASSSPGLLAAQRAVK